jgi:hypothetical protein
MPSSAFAIGSGERTLAQASELLHEARGGEHLSERVPAIEVVADAWRCGFGRITYFGKAIEAA